VIYFTLSATKGGRLHFKIFETEQVDDCIDFIVELLQDAQHYGIQQILKATGGGAHLYHDKLVSKLPFGVVIQKEDEMECLITGKSDESSGRSSHYHWH
jgi:type II pantothenate kinase